jgi:hypothetical protein
MNMKSDNLMIDVLIGHTITKSVFVGDLTILAYCLLYQYSCRQHSRTPSFSTMTNDLIGENILKNTKKFDTSAHNIIILQ